MLSVILKKKDMETTRKPDGFWQNKETCYEEAKKYKTRGDFKKSSGSAYNGANSNGWLDEICSHMVINQKPNGYWTKANCEKVAKNCRTKNELRKMAKSAYVSIIRNKWYDLFDHMIPQGNRYYRFLYSAQFDDGAIYFGLTGDFNRRKNYHLKNAKSTVFQYSQKTKLIPIIELVDGILYSIEEAGILEQTLVDDFRNNGTVVLNRAKCGGLGSNTVKWTKEKCHELASKCKTKSEFKKASSTAYASARKNKWLDEICSHMISPQKPTGHWNIKENCYLETKKYSNKRQFQIGSSGAYSACLKYKWLDEFFPKSK